MRSYMRSIPGLRMLLIVSGAAILAIVVWAGTKLGSKPVAAQVAPQFDAFVFHCDLIPNQTLETSNLGSFNLTYSSAASPAFSIQPSDCSKVIADALNLGYRLKSALALPNGGPNGTGATEYVFIRGGTD
jgi:hypothetical protein